MPQLNPNPWFFIFMVSWFMYLIILLPKINSLKMPSEPEAPHNKGKAEPLIWPWA